MSDPQTTLQRMALAFPDHEALADYVRMEVGTVRKVLDGGHNPGAHQQDKIDRAFEQIQAEHRAGAEAVSYALQTIERLKAGEIADDHLDNVQQVLQKKADQICTAWS